MPSKYEERADRDEAEHPLLREEGRDHQSVDRQARRTAHKRRDHDRRQTVFRVLDGTRRHDAGDGAREARKQRHESLAVQSHAAHQPVHQKRRARHVAAVFQERDEEEEQEDLRQEDEHAADAGDDAVGEQVGQQARRHLRACEFRERAKSPVNQVHRQRRPGEDRLEDQPHDEEQYEGAEESVRD
jgi:hypothetical protein